MFKPTPVEVAERIKTTNFSKTICNKQVGRIIINRRVMIINI